MTVSEKTLQPQVVSPSESTIETTAETKYLERLDATLDLVEQTVDHAVEREEKRVDVAVSVVIPVYNERDTIVEIVRQVQAVGLHHEIVIVDDYSLDGTREILLELEKQEGIRVFMHGYNRGKGAALRTAFTEIEGDVVIIQDADLEYDPTDYPKLLAPIENGETEVVYGSRFLENAHQDPSRLHRFGNWFLTTYSNWITGQRLTDMETCYKVFRREVIAEMQFEQNRFGFEPEITAKISRQGHKIVEVPITYKSRGYEEGKKIGIRDGLNAMWCIGRYAFLGA